MQKILWIDMEMTGLDVRKEVVIEVAAVITDWNFKVLDSYSTVIKQPKKYLKAMDDWNQRHHKESGLLEMIPKGKTPKTVETDLLAFIQNHYPADERIVIAGNSIAQDRLFINKYFKKLAGRLHYRMIDVTAWKIVMNGRFKFKFDKKDKHRAVDDINESIAELKSYTDLIKIEH